MPYDLVASMKLKDGMSTPLKRITSSVKGADTASKQLRKSVMGVSGGLSDVARNAGRTTSAITNMTRATNNARKAFDSMNSSSNSAFRSVIRGAAGIAAAYGSARLAVAAFNATIGAAALQQQQEITVSALFRGDTKSAQKYLSLLENKAANSTLSLTELLSGAKSSVIMTKDIQQLSKLTDVAQKLAILDPSQGYEGAIYALRELNSGDGVSLTERFEIPRSVVNAIKTLPLAKQLEAVNKELEKYGITDELISKQSTTLIGQRNKALANLRKTLRDMGTKSLSPLTSALVDVNRWLDRNSASISKFGSDILYGLSNKVKVGFEYIRKNYLDNPEFMKLPFADKVSTVLNDFKSAWDTWYSTTGKTMITSTTQGIIDVMSNTLGSPENIEKLAGIGLNLGRAMGDGLVKGINEFAKKNPLLSGLVVGAVTPGPLQVKVATGGATALDGIVKPITDRAGAWLGQKFIDGSHSGGLNRVPRDGYIARLHRNETVLNRNEARAYRNGSSGGNGVVINVDTLNVRKDSDISAIATQLAKELHSSQNATSMKRKR